ncbi:glycosyltransferase [Neobacillus drentensis]|uniref:glycosyltransferase n=1 Tax=Neobacillus drentensis TaxID=220684 RepID=UPI002862147E|nr:glycosyltransferase [Neobacillus drentensis]MDR7239976.1 glycosyltransferase involved in cell wall biosynthesis [Neobacillus drentensis]
MKKILFVIDSLCSGGAEKGLVSLLSVFNYKEYEIDLLMFSPTGLYLPLIPKDVRVLEVPMFIKKQNEGIKYLVKNKHFKELFIRLGSSVSHRIPFYNKKMHGSQISWKWMRKGIEKLDKKYDVAIAFSQGMPTYFVSEKVDSDKKLSWINTDYKQAAYNKQFDQKYYQKINQVIAISEDNKVIFTNEIQGAIDKTQVIYDIISPELIHSMAVEDVGFNDNFDGVRILTIGRLVHVKGYDMAIEACHKLKKNGYKVKWYVIGEGLLKNKLEKMIKDLGLEDNFILLGTFHNPYVFIKQCDIYVQPSRFEGYGTAIAEARILQKPIIATNFTVVNNQLKNRENGLIVEMNSDAIYEGIKDVIDDDNLKKHICTNLGKENGGTEKEINKLYSIIEA